MADDDAFTLQLADDSLADVAVDGDPQALPADWLATFDQCGIRLVAMVDATPGRPPDAAAAAAWLAGCSGALQVSDATAPGGGSDALLRAAAAAGLPTLRVAASGPPAPRVDHGGMATPGGVPKLPLALAVTVADAAAREAFIAAVLAAPCPRRAYAFFIGRLERDFDHARAALRAAVQALAGVDLLWSDDGLHHTSVPGIRERTRLLLRHARFVVADLSLGVENPRAENPSRAHEIGMALAYGRPLLLCSQEPRRYPYFSVADLQMSFWVDERELAPIVHRWLWPQRRALARQVLNAQLPESRLDWLGFHYRPELRFIGPNLATP